jgi:hypothetical protein
VRLAHALEHVALAQGEQPLQAQAHLQGGVGAQRPVVLQIQRLALHAGVETLVEVLGLQAARQAGLGLHAVFMAPCRLPLGTDIEPVRHTEGALVVEVEHGRLVQRPPVDRGVLHQACRAVAPLRARLLVAARVGDAEAQFAARALGAAVLRLHPAAPEQALVVQRHLAALLRRWRPELRLALIRHAPA